MTGASSTSRELRASSSRCPARASNAGRLSPSAQALKAEGLTYQGGPPSDEVANVVMDVLVQFIFDKPGAIFAFSPEALRRAVEDAG